MANVKLVNINKIYDGGVQAVYDFNLEVKDKEFIVFVGPSGCGKTTTLRMIAGLEEITSGQLYIDNHLANYVLPKDRDIAMVFQDYALYPHMTVYNNMAFGLKMRKIPIETKDKDGNVKMIYDNKTMKSLAKDNKYFEKKITKNNKEIANLQNNHGDEIFIKTLQDEIVLFTKYIKRNNEKLTYLSTNQIPQYKYVHMSKNEIKERITKAAQVLGIEDYLNRKPKELSGGQRQRVALGRAIVKKAKVFLMDEPLSNLDAKLRVQMRSELISLYERLETTVIYVTHDQTEAMTMATRIVVMKDGYIQQIDTPEEIYTHPKNKFVAGFIGSPSMNFMNAIIKGNEIVFENNLSLKMNSRQIEATKDYQNETLIIGIRPEDLILSDDGFEVETNFVELLGSDLIVHFDFNGSSLQSKLSSKTNVKNHEKIKISINTASIHAFNAENEETIF